MHPIENPYSKIESIEVELHKCIHPESWMKFDFPENMNAFIFKHLSRRDFNTDQVEFLVALRNRTKGFDIEKFVEHLYKNRSEVSEILPGFISQLDTQSWSKISANNQLKDLVKGKRVALVGPAQHMAGSKSAELIESYDIVVRLNLQWPVPTELKEDLGSRMDLLFHCCNGDVSIDHIACEELKFTKLICYELGLSSFKLKEIAQKYNVQIQNVSPTYWNLAQLLGTPPNTGTVATCLLLDTDLAELYITGLTYLQDPYYDGYPGHGSLSELWKDGKTPDKIGLHKIAPQFKYIVDLLNSDSRIKVDWRLRELLNP